jgi:acyl carrier protein
MTLTKATKAYERGKFSEAATLCLELLDQDPTSVSTVLLMARAMLGAGSYTSAITVAAAPTLDPKLRVHAAAYADALEDVIVDAIVTWAAAIEAGTMPKGDRKQFVEGTEFYAEHFVRYLTEVVGLERAIVKKVPVGDTFKDLVASKRGAKSRRGAKAPARKAAGTKPTTAANTKTGKPTKAGGKARSKASGTKSGKPVVDPTLTTILVQNLGCKAAEVVPTATFRTLGVTEKLDMIQLAMACEEAYGISIDDTEFAKLKTVRAAIDYIAAQN